MEILRRQRALGSVLTRFCLRIIETPEGDWTPGLAQTRMDVLRDYWEDFQQNHVELINETAEGADATERDQLYGDAEDNYIRARSKLCDVNIRIKPPTSDVGSIAEHTGNHGSPQLPRISIPKFSEKREDWESFRDLFKAMIHNAPNLSDVERLYYLKSHVQGEAKSSLDSLKISGSNYATAWGILEARYEHRRLLIQDHLMAL